MQRLRSEVSPNKGALRLPRGHASARSWKNPAGLVGFAETRDVGRVAPRKMVLEYGRRPGSKLRTATRTHSGALREDGIEVVLQTQRLTRRFPST